MKLVIKALFATVLGFVIIAILLFVPAGTICFTNAWLFIGVLFLPMLIMGAILLLKKPEMLEKRLKTNEKISSQKAVVALSSVMFIAGFVIAGLNFRFEWFALPFYVSVTASVVFLIGFLLYAEVIRENQYLSRVIEVQDGQKVVENGLYGIVRHPMYLSTLLMFLSIPIILGDVISVVVFLSYPVIITKRIKDEEQLLEKELSGYSEYKKKVRYKMIPFLW